MEPTKEEITDEIFGWLLGLTIWGLFACPFACGMILLWLAIGRGGS